MSISCFLAKLLTLRVPAILLADNLTKMLGGNQQRTSIPHKAKARQFYSATKDSMVVNGLIKR